MTFKNEILNARKIKKWELQSIKEVIKRPYRKIPQAIEIYFYNGKSTFFYFNDIASTNDFFNVLQKILYKNRHLQFDMIEKPDSFFAEKRYSQLWEVGILSNFEYLMLVNKYAGRSFHNIMQYPVFPWIINNYSEPKINIFDECAYRQLDCPIAGISFNKRQAADELWKYLNKTGAANHYQFKSTYLPGKAVIEYLSRIEPYSSKNISYAFPVFNSLKELWESCTSKNEENRELIYSKNQLYNRPGHIKLIILFKLTLLH